MSIRNVRVRPAPATGERFTITRDVVWAGRTREVVASFFDGLDLLEPGVVKVTGWRPQSEMEVEGPSPARRNAPPANPLPHGSFVPARRHRCKNQLNDTGP
jgi:hypothetical protein